MAHPPRRQLRWQRRYPPPRRRAGPQTRGGRGNATPYSTQTARPPSGEVPVPAGARVGHSRRRGTSRPPVRRARTCAPRRWREGAVEQRPQKRRRRAAASAAAGGHGRARRAACAVRKREAAVSRGAQRGGRRRRRRQPPAESCARTGGVTGGDPGDMGAAVALRALQAAQVAVAAARHGQREGGIPGSWE